MIEEFRKYGWSKYTQKTIIYYFAIGAIMGIGIVVGYYILSNQSLNLTPNDRLIGFVAIIGIEISIVAALMNQYYQNKQLQTTSMTRIFELLSSPEVRKAREEVHKEYCRLKNSEQEITFRSNNDSKMKEYVDKVLSSFDQVSLLVLNDLVDEDLFFEGYGEMIVRDWKTLEVEIKLRQQKNSRTLKHFTGLKDRFSKCVDKENAKRSVDKKISTEPYCEE